jgi:hypothetical protein
VRTGAAVGAGFRVLGEGDLDADKPAHIIGLTYARPEPEKEGNATEAAKIPRVHKKAPDDAGALRCQRSISTSTWREQRGSIPNSPAVVQLPLPYIGVFAEFERGIVRATVIHLGPRMRSVMKFPGKSGPRSVAPRSLKKDPTRTWPTSLGPMPNLTSNLQKVLV